MSFEDIFVHPYMNGMVLCNYFPFGKVSRIRAGAQLCVEGNNRVSPRNKGKSLSNDCVSSRVGQIESET